MSTNNQFNDYLQETLNGYNYVHLNEQLQITKTMLTQRLLFPEKFNIKELIALKNMLPADTDFKAVRVKYKLGFDKLTYLEIENFDKPNII